MDQQESKLAFSIHYLDIKKPQYEVVSSQNDVKNIDNIINFFIKFLVESLHQDKEVVLKKMFNISSTTASGEMREEIEDILKDIEKGVVKNEE